MAAPKPRKNHASFVPGYSRSNQGNYARGALPGEKKFLDSTAVNHSVSASGLIVPSLNLIPPGTSVNQRIGARVKLRNINTSVLLSLPSSTTASTSSDTVRIIWFVDHQCNGTAATAAQIIQDMDNATTTFQSFRAMTTVERFTILKDKVVNLNASNVVTNTHGESQRSLKFAWRGERVLHFSPNATPAITQISDVRSDNVGILLITQGATASVFLKTRIKYTE
jgi:hypothetical protein